MRAGTRDSGLGKARSGVIVAPVQGESRRMMFHVRVRQP